MSFPPSLPHPPAVSKAAIWSLILGIAGLVSASLTSIPAVICGHVALGKIKRHGGTLGGKDLAVAGLATGYVGLLIMPFILLGVLGMLLPFFLRK